MILDYKVFFGILSPGLKPREMSYNEFEIVVINNTSRGILKKAKKLAAQLKELELGIAVDEEMVHSGEGYQFRAGKVKKEIYYGAQTKIGSRVMYKILFHSKSFNQTAQNNLDSISRNYVGLDLDHATMGKIEEVRARARVFKIRVRGRDIAPLRGIQLRVRKTTKGLHVKLFKKLKMGDHFRAREALGDDFVRRKLDEARANKGALYNVLFTKKTVFE